MGATNSLTHSRASAHLLACTCLLAHLLTYSRTHARTHARTRARARAHTHALTYSRTYRRRGPRRRCRSPATGTGARCAARRGTSLSGECGGRGTSSSSRASASSSSREGRAPRPCVASAARRARRGALLCHYCLMPTAARLHSLPPLHTCVTAWRNCVGREPHARCPRAVSK